MSIDSLAWPGASEKADVAEFLAEHGAFDPAPVAALMLLRALGIDGGHFGEAGAVLELGLDFAGEIDGVGVVRREVLFSTIMRSLTWSSILKLS